MSGSHFGLHDHVVNGQDQVQWLAQRQLDDSRARRLELSGDAAHVFGHTRRREVQRFADQAQSRGGQIRVELQDGQLLVG